MGSGDELTEGDVVGLVRADAPGQVADDLRDRAGKLELPDVLGRHRHHVLAPDDLAQGEPARDVQGVVDLALDQLGEAGALQLGELEGDVGVEQASGSFGGDVSGHDPIVASAVFAHARARESRLRQGRRGPAALSRVPTRTVTGFTTHQEVPP